MSNEFSDAGIIEVKAIISGHVQGVGFRYTAKEQAQIMGIQGTARNLSDGTVEVVVQGSREQIDKFLEILTGPSGPGVVNDVKKIHSSPKQKFSGFRIF